MVRAGKEPVGGAPGVSVVRAVFATEDLMHRILTHLNLERSIMNSRSGLQDLAVLSSVCHGWRPLLRAYCLGNLSKYWCVRCGQLYRVLESLVRERKINRWLRLCAHGDEHVEKAERWAELYIQHSQARARHFAHTRQADPGQMASAHTPPPLQCDNEYALGVYIRERHGHPQSTTSPVFSRVLILKDGNRELPADPGSKALLAGLSWQHDIDEDECHPSDGGPYDSETMAELELNVFLLRRRDGQMLVIGRDVACNVGRFSNGGGDTAKWQWHLRLGGALIRLEAELVASGVMSDVERSDSGYDEDEDESDDRERSLHQYMTLNLVLKGEEADASTEVHAPQVQEQLLRLLDVPQVAHLWV